jgi:tRNA(Ile)-lysidine synthase
MSLPDRIQGFAERHGLWTPDEPVLAAVSGGADSVALLLILRELADEGRVTLASVAHLHHHVRGAEADRDAEFVGQLADRLRLPFELAHENVPALARRSGRSLEVAGRDARLAFFERLSRRQPSPVVALAHTRSDQAETVLLRLARGAGPRGLAGMAPRRGHMVRPLLEVGREELRAWLRERGEHWREDTSNQDTSIPRNQVRRVVIPSLARVNPAVEEVLARTARIQGADAALLEQLAAAEAVRLVTVASDGVRLDLEGLGRLPEAVARRVVRHALQIAHPGRAPDWQDTEAVLNPSGPRLLVGPVRVELFGQSAVLSSRGLTRGQWKADTSLDVVQTLDVPGSVRHPSGWWEVEATGPTPFSNVVPTAVAEAAAAAASTDTRAVLDARALGGRLTIRGWRPGDRVQPLGLGGRKKLQDVFVDRKVARDERLRVPVVVDAQGRIAWVAGHVVGEPFKVTPHSEAVVVLTLRR